MTGTGKLLACGGLRASGHTYTMAAITKIQWADTTVNPIMGCGGCELYPPTGKVLQAVADAMNEREPGVAATRDSIKRIFKKLVDDVFTHSENPHQGHIQTVNATNIWHLRKRFEEKVRDLHGQEVATAADNAIKKAITCYAGVLHLNKGAKILDREGNPPGKDEPREVKTGYAPIFEMPTQFKGRSKKTANYKDLLGRCHPKTPWKERLPRLIFVSDMGDALSAEGDFPFLKADLMPAIQSESGLKHLWLWLTKRPKRMAKFADQIGGFPANVCAMTTLTGADEESLQRLSDLKLVNASMRGLSVEPLWDRIPPAQLDLGGIDWVILGGESGSGDLTRPFALEWVEELREHCRENGVAFFLKQLGRNPTRDGEVFRLKNAHGGNWDEWDESLRIREFPQAFHDYRKDEMTISDTLRPIPKKKKKKPSLPEDLSITPQEKAEYEINNKIVEKGVKAFWEVGSALGKIKEGKLWRAGGHKSWDDYCRSVAGMSRIHAHRLVEATEFVNKLKTLPRGNVLPLMEAQVRPILRLPEDQQAETWFAAFDEVGGQPSAPRVNKLVHEKMHPAGLEETPEVQPEEEEEVTEESEVPSERRDKIVNRLKAAIRKRKSWEQVEKLMEELVKLL